MWSQLPGFELVGDGAGAQIAQVGDVVVEGARGDSEQLGDRSDRAAGVGQQVAGGPDDLLGGDGGASPDPAAARAAARLSRVPWTMSSRMNSARAAKTWKTSRPPGGGGVEVLVQRGEANDALAQCGDHVDEVLEAAAVAVERGDDQRVAGGEEGVARLQLRAQVGLAGLLVREDLPASGGGEGVDLLFELLAASRHTGVPDLDLGAYERFGDEEFGMAGWLREVTRGLGSCQKTVIRGS